MVDWLALGGVMVAVALLADAPGLFIVAVATVGLWLAHPAVVAIRDAARRVHAQPERGSGGGRRRRDAGRHHLEPQAAAAAVGLGR